MKHDDVCKENPCGKRVIWFCKGKREEGEEGRCEEGREEREGVKRGERGGRRGKV